MMQSALTAVILSVYNQTPIDTEHTPLYTSGLPSLATDTGAYTFI